MSGDREAELEAAALAHDRERQNEIEALREEAIAESEHGWRSLLFTVVDSLAAGTVLGISAGISLAECLLLYGGARLGVRAMLAIGGIPLAGLAIVLAIILEPLHRSGVGTRRFAANALLAAWLVGVLILLIAAVAATIR